MNSQTYTNAVLTLIAGLLCLIAWQMHERRPVTIGDMRAIAEYGDLDRLNQFRLKLPLVQVHGGALEVDVQSPITVDNVQDAVTVRIER